METTLQQTLCEAEARETEQVILDESAKQTHSV